jgi:hypothetical protein
MRVLPAISVPLAVPSRPAMLVLPALLVPPAVLALPGSSHQRRRRFPAAPPLVLCCHHATPADSSPRASTTLTRLISRSTPYLTFLQHQHSLRLPTLPPQPPAPTPPRPASSRLVPVPPRPRPASSPPRLVPAPPRPGPFPPGIPAQPPPPKPPCRAPSPRPRSHVVCGPPPTFLRSLWATERVASALPSSPLSREHRQHQSLLQRRPA